MGNNIGKLPVGRFGLIQEQDDSTISQFGLTEKQSKMLESFLSAMSQDRPLIKLPEDYDLVLKRNT